MAGAAELAGLVLLALIALGQGGLMFQIGSLKSTVDQHARLLEHLTGGQ